MRFHRKVRIRPAFTLLEVLLASAIALLLFGGLYVSMQVELGQASAGRDLVERATLSRAIINRMSMDLTESLTPSKAKPKSRSSSTTTNQSTAAPTTNTSGAAGTTTTADTSSAEAVEMAAEIAVSAIPLQAGVIGTDLQLTIFTTRVPGRMIDSDNPEAPVPSDIRRITYWLREGGGLCRQEIPWVTGQDVYGNTDPVITDDEDEFVIAPEVTELSFEYYDINTTSDNEVWGTSWDGSTPGADMRTPMGPPTAIRVTFWLRIVDSEGNVTSKKYVHVIPILTASGPSIEEPVAPETTDGTTSTTTTP